MPTHRSPPSYSLLIPRRKVFSFRRLSSQHNVALSLKPGNTPRQITSSMSSLFTISTAPSMLS